MNTILSYSRAYGSRFEDFIVAAAEQEFSAVQLIPDQTPNLIVEFDSERRSSLRALAESLGVELHVHSVYYDINYTSLVPEVRDSSKAVVRSVIDLAKDIGGRSVTIHTGYMFGGWRSQEQQTKNYWRNAEPSMRELGDYAASRQMPLLIENGSYYLTSATGQHRTPLHIGVSPEELRAVVEMFGKAARISLDLNKARVSGFGVDEHLSANADIIDQVQVSSEAAITENLPELSDWTRCRGPDASFVLEGRREALRGVQQALTRIESQSPH
tara:strand:- start:269000 stop:269812 length:813 start_codon:yes stop_codon:yes gene_type:complete